MSGLFITFEGGEGSGKSTQIRRLSQRLTEQGRKVLLTREPGGTPEAEALRGLLVSGDTGRWTAEAEAMLNYAARDSHLTKRIRPALAAGDIVLCDRFMDSTRAYQGYAGHCSFALIDALEAAIVGATRPVRTVIFDLDPAEGLHRAHARGDTAVEDRFERMGLAFHQTLRHGFQEIAKADPGRCRLINAGGDVTAVERAVWAAIEDVI
jgi:dTMP kinase